MIINRRSAMGTLIGAAAASCGDTSPLRAVNEVTASSMLCMLETFRISFNAARAEELYPRWSTTELRLLAWGESVDIGADGLTQVNDLFKAIRKRLGTITRPVAAGQFLIAPDGATIRYFPQFFDNGRMSSLEILFLLADDPSSNVAKLREIHITDSLLFMPAVASVVDVQADGRKDVSVEVQAAYDALVRRGGGTLQFPPGVFQISLTLGSRNVQLRGSGRLATQLLARSPGDVVLRGAYRSGTWDAVTISDLTITGGGALTGIGFRAGGDTPAENDEFVGRTRFVNVRFVNLDTCIDRPRGQIGLNIEACQFEDAKVHLAAQSHLQVDRPMMHSGNILVRGTHFQQARDAVLRMDSTVTGSGQITFQDCIMESNPGIVFDIRNLNAIDSVPAVLVSRCWNEQNGTASSVMIDGRPEKPVYARLTNCALVRFDDTPVGSLKLCNSVVRTLDCSLDQLHSISQDANSLVEHTRARMFSGPIPPGQVSSIEATYLNAPGRGVSFSLPHRTALSGAYRDQIKTSLRADSQISFSGSTTVTTKSVADCVLPGVTAGQELRLEPGMQIFPQPVALSAGSWIAWLYLYRHVVGSVPTLTLTGSAGLTLETPLDDANWSTLGGMTFVAADVSNISFWVRCTATPATIHLGGINLMSFKTRQQARDYVNSGLFAI